MIGSDLESRKAFILANTRLQVVPHAPELSLWLADEITPIWRLTEEALGELGLPPPFWAFAWAGGQALARYLTDRPAEVAGARVLDFAAGSGLAGLAAARAGAAEVLSPTSTASARPPSPSTPPPTASRSASRPETCWTRRRRLRT